MEPFTFDLKTSRKRFTKDEIIQGLRRFAKAHPNRTLSASLYNAWRGKLCNYQSVARQFGSWRAALLAAELPLTRKRYSAKELMDALEHVWRQLGSAPGEKALKKRTGIDHRPYTVRWGSLPKARQRLASFHRGEISREMLLAPTPRPRRARHLRPGERYAILARDHFRCVLCGANPKSDPSVTLHVDHIHPVSRGGTSTPDNLRTLCSQCNYGKGARTIEPRPRRKHKR
jgi:hypothetical protein